MNLTIRFKNDQKKIVTTGPRIMVQQKDWFLEEEWFVSTLAIFCCTMSGSVSDFTLKEPATLLKLFDIS